MKKQNKIQWVFSSRNNQELAERYDQWAKDYDANLEKDLEYRGPQLIAEYFTKYVPKEARILDAGAGTGLMGKVLTKLGYHNLVAIDMSRHMLEEARRKKMYSELHQMIMGEPLAFAINSFDAIVSVAVFAVGHAPASSLDELIRITRPGGYIVFTVHLDAYENLGFKEKQVALEAEGEWKLVEESEPYRLSPVLEPATYHQIWVYQA